MRRLLLMLMYLTAERRAMGPIILHTIPSDVESQQLNKQLSEL